MVKDGLFVKVGAGCMGLFVHCDFVLVKSIVVKFGNKDDTFDVIGVIVLMIVDGDVGDDDIWIGDGVDMIYGNMGVDLLHGFKGKDHLIGDLGNDYLFG